MKIDSPRIGEKTDIQQDILQFLQRSNNASFTQIKSITHLNPFFVRKNIMCLVHDGKIKHNVSTDTYSLIKN